MNKQEFFGRVVADPQLKVVGGDKQVCSFRLAVNGRTKNDPPIFINCEAWGKPAEVIARYCPKGYPLGIVTRMKQHTYEKNGVNITVDDFVVEEFDLLGSKQNEQ